MIRLAHVTTIIAGIGSEYLSHHFRGVLYTESPASVHALLLLARCALRYAFIRRGRENVGLVVYDLFAFRAFPAVFVPLGADIVRRLAAIANCDGHWCATARPP
jgi:hypothetical protein